MKTYKRGKHIVLDRLDVYNLISAIEIDYPIANLFREFLQDACDDMNGSQELTLKVTNCITGE